MDNAVWEGVAQAGSSATVPALMRGIDSFVNDTANGTAVDAATADLSEDHLNDLVEMLHDNGLPDNEPLVAIGSSETAREITRIRKNKTTFADFQRAQDFGGRVQVYYSELGDHPMVFIAMPKLVTGTLYVLSQSNIKLVAPLMGPTADASSLSFMPETGLPNGLAWIVDSTTPGQHGVKRTLRSQLSLKVYAPLKLHGVIYNYGIGAVSA
jgi:hypothetical protein